MVVNVHSGLEVRDAGAVFNPKLAFDNEVQSKSKISLIGFDARLLGKTDARDIKSGLESYVLDGVPHDEAILSVEDPGDGPHTRMTNGPLRNRVNDSIQKAVDVHPKIQKLAQKLDAPSYYQDKFRSCALMEQRKGRRADKMRPIMIQEEDSTDEDKFPNGTSRSPNARNADKFSKSMKKTPRILTKPSRIRNLRCEFRMLHQMGYETELQQNLRVIKVYKTRSRAFFHCLHQLGYTAEPVYSNDGRRQRDEVITVTSDLSVGRSKFAASQRKIALRLTCGQGRTRSILGINLFPI